MFSSSINWLFDKVFSFLDVVISWFFKIFPNDFLLEFINPYLDQFFDFMTDILLSMSYFLDMTYFSYLLFLIFYLETLYIVLRFLVWLMIRIIKP